MFLSKDDNKSDKTTFYQLLDDGLFSDIYIDL